MLIYVECNPDTALVHALNIPRHRIRHLRGKGEVVKLVAKAGSAVGLIDEDPLASQPRALSEFREVASCGSVSVLRHKAGGSRFLLVLKPRLEEWLCQCATSCGVNLADYELPRTGEKLHDVSRYDKLPGFPRLVGDLLKWSPEMRFLKSKLHSP